LEERWYQHWLNKGYFNSKPDARQPYTVVIPPPNVTGVLHMGHTLNETVQDVLVRKARMSGYNACWVPGSDHASIATEAKVVQMLTERGISKYDLSRDEFLAHAFEWKDKYGDIIYHQIKKLGCSVDWNRVTFTMDDHYYKAVIRVFVDLYKKGMIYRGARMINWDPAAKTALSDEEVEYKDVQGTLYYINYPLVGLPGDASPPIYITIATQRPETIMGDTAVCVHPTDLRYQHLRGRKIMVPLVNREVPLIFDEYVDPAFGTGALKVTPAHDINDYNLGLKHGLQVIDTLNEDGTISEAAEVFVGIDRFDARKKAIEQLKSEGLLLREETYPSRLGYSQRTAAVVEPRISTQWFVKMRGLANKALEPVLAGEVKIHPEERFLATYKYWLEGVKDWCISRQLWWGQRIPAWYDQNGKVYVAETEEEAKQEYTKTNGGSLLENEGAWARQDEDVLDTWFSSWLWPMEVFKGISNPGNSDINYYYPTSVVVTGQDIIFFWVARMIMAGEEYRDQKPFSHVYFTGMVRDKQGRKMSKSLGNSPDLLELIQKFGADAVRFGILISAPAGNDLLFDESSCDQGRSFNNKLWNALKLLKIWEERAATQPSETHASNTEEQGFGTHAFATEWFSARLNEVKAAVEKLYAEFKLSEALKTIYSLIWDDFCSWYLEWIKPGFNEALPTALYDKTVGFFEALMQLLHPFMPFITEEIYHQLSNKQDDLCVKQFNPAVENDSPILTVGEVLKQSITAIRDIRARNSIKPKDPVKLFIQTATPANYEQVIRLLGRQTSAEEINFVDAPVPAAITVVLNKDRFYIQTQAVIDSSVQKEQMLKDLNYYKGFLKSVETKLNNERFVQNAKPEVVESERNKKQDALQKIQALEEGLSRLS
ncbi:MAG: valine--tRNA ligase, partial [Chitinophagaceae bacterium]